MSRPAPAAVRALAILDFLAAHPTESFTLSELARELHINPASAHAVLGAMTEAGYLVRHPTHKTYRLGPSTMAVGHAALASHPVIGVAREEMQRLADETGLECMASAPLDMELVAVARVGPSDRARPLIEVGQRMPLVPPLGIMFLAWSSPERVDAWLQRIGPDEPSGARDRYRRLLESARTLGYNVSVEHEGRGVPVPPVKGDPGRLDLDPAERHHVVHIAATSFDHRGEVSLVINFAGFDQPLTVDEITDLGVRLRRAAAFITEAVHGRAPSFEHQLA
jgi:DNA-binding IclR family transcriptional regulator